MNKTVIIRNVETRVVLAELVEEKQLNSIKFFKLITPCIKVKYVFKKPVFEKGKGRTWEIKNNLKD